MFHTTKFLYLYFLIGGIIGLGNDIISKTLVKNISPYTILAVDSVIYIVLLLITLAVLGKYTLIKNELLSLDTKYLYWLGFGGIISVISSIFFLFILKHQDLGHTRSVNYAFNIMITMIGSIIVFNEKLTIQKIIGLIMVIGGFGIFEH
jgi:uncharacterized membrane protein